MTFILLLIVAILLLVFFIFMELTELALGTLVLIVLSSGGMVVIDPTTAWLVFGTVALAAVVVIGLLIYRFSGRSTPPSGPSPGEHQ